MKGYHKKLRIGLYVGFWEICFTNIYIILTMKGGDVLAAEISIDHEHRDSYPSLLYWLSSTSTPGTSQLEDRTRAIR